MWKNINPNPAVKRVGDCTVRALCTALGISWEKTYVDLCIQGFIDCDMPSSNVVWGHYLVQNGFKRNLVSLDCDNCYTVLDFCKEHPKGTYVLALDKHVIAVIDGNYCDTWNSGDENVIFYWERTE